MTPIFKGLFDHKQDGEEIYYSHELKSKLKFADKQDYNVFYQNREDECNPIKIEISRDKGHGVYEYWVGEFTIFDCTFNFDHCWIEVKPKNIIYRCFDINKKKKINVWGGDVINSEGVLGVYDQAICDLEDNFQGQESDDFSLPPYAGCIQGEEEFWWLFEDDFRAEFIAVFFQGWRVTQKTTWHRDKVVIDCVNGQPVPPSVFDGWKMLEGCVDGKSTWVRDPAGAHGGYKNGRTMKAFLESAVYGLGCGLQVKSDFFNINPADDAPINKAYQYAEDHLKYLTVHQKSDVKRKNNPTLSTAPSWVLKFADLMADLRILYNVYYAIYGNLLVIEHYTYFTNGDVIDDAAEPMDLQIDYTGNDKVGSEQFRDMDDYISEKYNAETIQYDCGEEDKPKNLTLFTNAIAVVEGSEIPEGSDADETISDEGFCIVGNVISDGRYYMATGTNISQTWTPLLQNLHTFGRLYRSGTLNGIKMEFDSHKPYKKQPKYKVDDCGKRFNPRDKRLTKLGNGLVTSAEQDIYNDTIELNVSY